MKMPFVITNGPGKDKMYSLSEFGLCPEEKTIVCFVLEDGTTMQVKITILWHKDGDVTYYNFKGFLQSINGDSLCEGHYNADNHTGTIQLID